MKRMVLLVVILSAVLAGIFGYVRFNQMPDDELSAVLRDGVSADSSLEVYEGLPHWHSNADLFAREKLRSDILEHDGAFFYSAPKALSSEDAAALERVLFSEKTYWGLGAATACIFHADFLVQRRGSRSTAFQICFGCGECKIVTNNISIKRTLRAGGIRSLEKVLEKYHSEHPDMRDKSSK